MACMHPVAMCSPLCRDSACTLGKGCSGCGGCKLGGVTWLEWANMAELGKRKTCTEGSTPAKQCKCPNGTPETGDSCAGNGATRCARCDTGFTINTQKTACTQNQCKCPNGTPKAGTACASNGADGCARCDDGCKKNSNKKKCNPVARNVPNSNKERGPACSCLSGFTGTLAWAG